jgi:anti-anti-sigma factor
MIDVLAVDLAAADPPPLAVAMSTDGWQLLAQVTGTADHATCGTLRDALVPHLLSGQRLVLDLSGVTYMDLSGVLENARSTLSADGGSLVLRNPSSAAHSVLSVSGLGKLFDTEIG